MLFLEAFGGSMHRELLFLYKVGEVHRNYTQILFKLYNCRMDILSEYQKEQRPWGGFERFTKNEPTTVKILSINPNQEFSLQEHERRTEFWKVIGGDGTVTVGEKQSEATVGDEFLVEPKNLHRAKAGPDGLKILEISFGDFDENDIKRVEDDYGRV